MAKNTKKKESLIGHQLVNKGIITAKQLRLLMDEQRKGKSKGKREKLGELLLKHGFADEKKLSSFLEDFLGIKYANLKQPEFVPDPAAVKLVPESIARQFKLVPLKLDTESNKLIVAMANPLDLIALDTLKMKTGYEIDTRFAFEHEVEDVIIKLYRDAALKKSIDEFVNLKAEETEQEVRSQELLEVDAAIKTPIIDLVDQVLRNAIREGASDIHIEPAEKRLRIRYRIDGLLQDQPSPPKELQSAVITRMKLLSNMDIAEHRLPQDGRFKFVYRNSNIDFRVASSPTVHGEKLVMRVLDSSSLMVRMEDLGIDVKNLAEFKAILKQSYGLMLVTGPTGSGKTTTLYSALSYINTPDKNIVTIEDPVEYQLPNINQIQTKHQIGLTFAAGLRTVLRQDPDIIMIGEIRDLETLENAVKAALTGHMVLSTIHTNNAPSTIARMHHMGLEPYLIASCLSLVIAQRLVRKICSNCKEKLPLSSYVLKGLEKRVGMSLAGLQFYVGKGCPKCKNSGYKGRTGLYEFFYVTKEVKKLILEGASEAAIKELALKQGMIDIFHAGLNKVNEGSISIEELLRVTVLDKSGGEGS